MFPAVGLGGDRISSRKSMRPSIATAWPDSQGRSATKLRRGIYQSLHIVDQTRKQIAHLCDSGLFDFQKHFVFGKISFVMRRIQYAPTAGRPIQGMHQALKDSKSILAAIAMPSQRCQRCRMGGVVCAGKTAFEREILKTRIFKASTRHAEHSGHLDNIPRFSLELADTYQVIQRLKAHQSAQSKG